MNPTCFSLVHLPKDVVLERIVPALAAEFQVFSIISLGTASRALCGPEYLGEVLAQLRGDAPESGDAALAICSRMRFTLRSLTWLAGNLRGIHAILRQAWTQGEPAPLLNWIPRQTVLDWEQHLSSCAKAQQADVAAWDSVASNAQLQHSMPVSLQQAVDHAIQSGQGILSVLLKTAEVQAEAREDLGLEDIVGRHLPNMSRTEQLAFVHALFTHPKLEAVSYFHLGLAPLSEGVAQQWLDLQIDKGFVADICSRERKWGVLSPCLRLIEFVCRQFGPESEARARYLRVILSGLEGGQQRISASDLEELVKVLDHPQRVPLWRWLTINEGLRVDQPRANLDVAALNRALASLTVSRDLQVLDPNQYLVPVNQSNTSSNSSHTAQSAKRRRKKRPNCALM